MPCGSMTQQFGSLAGLSSQWSELLERRRDWMAGHALGRRPVNRCSPHVRRPDIEHCEQQRLEAVKALRREAVETESGQFIEPW